MWLRKYEVKEQQSELNSVQLKSNRVPANVNKALLNSLPCYDGKLPANVILNQNN